MRKTWQKPKPLVLAVVFCLAFMLIGSSSLQAESPIEAWVARYNGPGNDQDYAYDLAVDARGNVYVTGFSYGSGTNEDYATIKYDRAGNQIWVARYNGPANDWDCAEALAVDARGNVYVTGYSKGITYDYATIKYDRAGNQIWVARYDGPVRLYDRAYDLAVDARGNVYVTGQSYDNGTSDDYATIKYDRAGNQLWVARYNGPVNLYDRAYALVVDDSGNVYVTGESNGSGTSRDYATIKYDNDGNQVWVARYNGPGNYWDFAYALAVDARGNVYVTGASYGSGMHYDYATIKYDNDGNQVWVARYNGPGNDRDLAYALAVDARGNVYVTGGSEGITYDYATIKYDSAGNQAWVARYDGPGNSGDVATALALDALGNVYVTGYSFGSTHYDYATIKYDSDGNQLWLARYNGPGNSGDVAYGLALDALGNVHVTGTSYGSGTCGDYATIKYAIPPEEAIGHLIATVESLMLPSGIETSLKAPLEAAAQALEKGNNRAAIQQLSTFINLVEAQRGKQLTEEEADSLIAAAESIIASIESSGAAPPLVRKPSLWYTQRDVKPTVTKLHANYPNPFNPETWIPFQLKGDADVVVRICTASGQVIRTLNLGLKPAGFYISRDRAAYWDGKNEADEHVASGIYFYIMQAGDSVSTRKMVVAE